MPECPQKTKSRRQVRLTIHSKALLDIFSGNIDSISASTFLSSKIATTPELILEYAAEVGSDLGFQAWLPLAMTHGRITTHQILDCPTPIRSLPQTIKATAAASYFGASKLVARRTALENSDYLSLLGVGINIIEISTPLIGVHGGDNPVHTVALVAGGMSDFSLLDSYVAAEEQILVYDKYINNESCELLEYIAKKLPDSSNLKVFNSSKTGAHLLTAPAVLHRLTTANPKISIECQSASPAFCKKEHDRYMFFGNRMQAIFTAGLDCFGRLNLHTGRRSNKRSQIIFYDVSHQAPQHIEGADGRTFPASFHA